MRNTQLPNLHNVQVTCPIIIFTLSLTNKVSTECPHCSKVVWYSTAVTSQRSLNVTMTIEYDSLIVSNPIKPIASDTVLGNF